MKFSTKVIKKHLKLDIEKLLFNSMYEHTKNYVS